MDVRRGKEVAGGPTPAEQGLASAVARIESLLREVERRLTPAPPDRADGAADWLTTAEFAGAAGRSENTVRLWCWRGRLRAEKAPNGHAWRIRVAELRRYRKEGLIPAEAAPKKVAVKQRPGRRR